MADLAQDLNDFQNIVESAEGAEQIFAALEVFCKSYIGVQLFSCSVFDLTVYQAKRTYTNDPVSYPLSGLKDIPQSRWTESVIERGEIFIANDVAGFSDVFEDHEKIAKLGYASAVNVPVIIKQTFIGTVNLLHQEGYYTPEICKKLPFIKLPAMVAFAALDN